MMAQLNGRTAGGGLRVGTQIEGFATTLWSTHYSKRKGTPA